MSKDIEDKIIDLYQDSGMTIDEVIFSLKKLLYTSQKAREEVKSEKKRLIGKNTTRG